MKKPEQLREEFWKQDMESGGLIYSQYAEIKQVISAGDMDWVLRKLQEIKQFAIEHTEYYKEYSPEDEFPVMSKMHLVENYESHTSDGGFMTPIHVSSTSGSTGTPFSVKQDKVKRMRNIADIKVFGEFCDYPSHERMVFFRVINSKLHRTPEQEDAENIYYIDSSDLGEKRLGEMTQVILEKKPRIIFSYSTTLVELAKYIRDNMGEVTFSMKAVLTGGEGVSEENRRMLGEVFGCKVYRRYSDMELGILGQDMGDGGRYRLNWGSYYFETLKTDSDEPAEYGEVGRIVITDLFNKAFPMIRYDTGDLGVMEKPDDGGWPYLSEIFGRSRDCVYCTDGILLSPAKISVMMWGQSGIKQWQFIQNDRTDYTIKLNTDGEIDVPPLLCKFTEVLGKDANIHVEFVDEIPVQASNKRRAVICNYEKG